MTKKLPSTQDLVAAYAPEVKAFASAPALLEWASATPGDLPEAERYIREGARWRAVAENASVLDRPLLDALARHAELVRALMWNQTLRESTEHGQMAIEVCLDILESDMADKNTRWQAIPPFGYLAKLGRVPGSGPLADRLWAVMEKLDRSGYRDSSLRSAILSAPDLPAERVRALVLRGEDSLFQPCCKHPNADEFVWMEALRQRYSPAILSCLAEVPAARANPKVRRALRGYGVVSGQVLLHLMADHVPGEFPVLLRELQDIDPAAAAVALQQASEAERATLSQDDLAPLLHSEDQSARLAAIAALGQARAMELVRGVSMRAPESTPSTRPILG